MECNTPPPLTDDELSLALDGLADDGIQQHLVQCPACAERLDAMRQFETDLQGRLRRFECPPPRQLADYHVGMLDDEVSAAVQKHVVECPRCQKELEMLVGFLNLSPQELVADKIIPLFPSKNVLRAGSVQVIGSLALKGLDDETSHDAKAGSASIFLESKAAPKGYVLTGQVVDSQVDWTGAIAEAWQEGTQQQVRLLDDMGEFSFELTGRTPVTLHITSAGGLILTVENISIQT
jgi:hypothetical protein